MAFKCELVDDGLNERSSSGCSSIILVFSRYVKCTCIINSIMYVLFMYSDRVVSLISAALLLFFT